MIYRIYTEDKNRQMILNYLTEWTPSFTIIPAIGVWRSVREDTLIIELIGEELTIQYIKAIAQAIKIMNNQECILITSQTGNEIFLGEDENV